MTTPQNPPFRGKRFFVQVGTEIVKRTDDASTAENKINELQKANTPDFTLIDRLEGRKTHYFKESYQKNYRTTVTKEA